MPSTTTETYRLSDLRRDAGKVAKLAESARADLVEAATIARRVADKVMFTDMPFTFAFAISQAADGIASDIDGEEVSTTTIAEEGRDTVKLLETLLASSEEASVDG